MFSGSMIEPRYNRLNYIMKARSLVGGVMRSLLCFHVSFAAKKSVDKEKNLTIGAVSNVLNSSIHERSKYATKYIAMPLVYACVNPKNNMTLFLKLDYFGKR